MLTENLGHYTVEDRVFYNKIEAILHVSSYGGDLKWHYCDQIFGSRDWTKEPLLHIDEYYKLRAQQIRDNYDYIVIRCSGGADSTNVLYSFLNNRIYPDEIVGESPLSGLKNWQWNDKDTNVINTISEHKFAQLPLLHEIATKYTTVKVSHVDSFERIYNPMPDNWFINCHDGIDYHASIEGTLWSLNHLHEIAESGKKIAIVTGTDKPYVLFDDDGNVKSCLVDLALNYLKKPLRENYPNVHRVPFYWTPDFPEILIKMSHLVAKKIFGKSKDYKLFATLVAKQEQGKKVRKSAFNGNKDDIIKYLIRPLNDYTAGVNVGFNPGSLYQRAICPYIYPSTYNSKVFQADKNTANQTFFSPLQDWFRILHKDSKAIQIIHSDFANFYKMIDPKFLNSTGTSFRDYTKLYNIGKISDFVNRE